MSRTVPRPRPDQDPGPGVPPWTAPLARRRAGGKTRERSEAAGRAILDAALALLDEVGYRALTIEAIAARAGAGKTTIYRRWPSLAALVLDAYIRTADRQIAAPDTGSLQADLTKFLGESCEALAQTGAGVVMATLMAEAQGDPELARRLREGWIAQRRAALRGILDRGARRGELRPGTDLELAVDSLYGPMWYRLLNGHGPLNVGFAKTLVGQVLTGCGGEPRATTPGPLRPRPSSRRPARNPGARVSERKRPSRAHQSASGGDLRG